MNLCGRCVMYLQSRMLCIKPQHVVNLNKNTTCIQTALLLHPHSRLQRWKDKWTDSYGIRFFSDQRTDSPPCLTDSRITERHNPQHGLVPVMNSEFHQCSSAPGPVPAEHTSIGICLYSSTISFPHTYSCTHIFTQTLCKGTVGKTPTDMFLGCGKKPKNSEEPHMDGRMYPKLRIRPKPRTQLLSRNTTCMNSAVQNKNY